MLFGGLLDPRASAALLGLGLGHLPRLPLGLLSHRLQGGVVRTPLEPFAGSSGGPGEAAGLKELAGVMDRFLALFTFLGQPHLLGRRRPHLAGQLPQPELHLVVVLHMDKARPRPRPRQGIQRVHADVEAVRLFDGAENEEAGVECLGQAQARRRIVEHLAQSEAEPAHVPADFAAFHDLVPPAETGGKVVGGPVAAGGGTSPGSQFTRKLKTTRRGRRGGGAAATTTAGGRWRQERAAAVDADLNVGLAAGQGQGELELAVGFLMASAAEQVVPQLQAQGQQSPARRLRGR